jgi:hypothetical protein
MAAMFVTAALKRFAAGTTLHHKPSRVVAASMMVASVSADRQDLKVFQSVVVLDAVFVVDVFISSKSAPNVALHDDTVLKLVAIANAHGHVPIRPDKSAHILSLSAALH